VSRYGPTLAILAHAHAKSGDQESALAILAELEELRESPDRGYASPAVTAALMKGILPLRKLPLPAHHNFQRGFFELRTWKTPTLANMCPHPQLNGNFRSECF